MDIYHPTQSRLTGKEIAFGGDLTRSIKGGANYLVLETQAQGQPGWLPYPGQLRLQAYSHLASGADAVMYWHWHSIHSSFETYWRGLLSHDLEANPTYDEAGVVGGELARAGSSLLHLRKTNRIAVMVSNEALTALTWFTIETGFPERVGPSIGYNDVLRWVYDALFELNLECDFVSPDTEDLDRYAMVVVPALYTAPESTLRRLRDVRRRWWPPRLDVQVLRRRRARQGLGRPPAARADRRPRPHLQPVHPARRRGAHPARRPGRLPGAAALTADDLVAQRFMELLRPDGAEVLASYVHPAWGDYAAVTRHRSGAGTAMHLGTMVGPALLREVLTLAARDAGLWHWSQDLAGVVSVRRGVNVAGRHVDVLPQLLR